MAIAFNAAADGGNNGGLSSSWTFSYTVGSGANRLLVIPVVGDNITGGANDITSVTYGGIAAVRAAEYGPTGASDGLRFLYFYYLLNPPSGANNVVITAATSHYILAGAADYTGVAQSGQPDVVVTAEGNGTGVTLTATTTVANDWLIAITSASAVQSAGAGATGPRAHDGSYNLWAVFDSGAPIASPGSTSLTINATASSGTLDPFGIMAAFAQASSGTSFSATPGIGLIAASSNVPTLSAGATTQPGRGSTTISGAVPTLSAGASLAPGLGTIHLTGATPSASAGATLSPGAGLLSLTGRATSVSAGAALAPGTGTLSLIGYTPTVSAGASFTANPGAGYASFVGGAVSVSAGASFATGAGLIGIPGAAPGVSAGASLPAGMGLLTVTGFAPTVSTATTFPPFTPDPRRTGTVPYAGRFSAIPRSSRFGTVGE